MKTHRCPLLTALFFGGLAACLPLTTAAYAQPPAKAVKPPVANQSKGQSQTAGADGEFGVVYTLKNQFNLEILSARYTIDAFDAFNAVFPGKDEKLLIAEIAVKNVSSEDNFFNTGSYFTAVDAKGALIDQSKIALASRATTEDDPTLKPGQGLGQTELHDPLRVAFVVPAKARIVKIILNQGRKGRDEDVIRYYIAGATKAEAGEAGEPKNIITPLPVALRDAADPTGASVIDIGKAVLGTPAPSGQFTLRLDSFAYTTDSVVGAAPEEGKRFAVATITATNVCSSEASLGDCTNGDPYVVANADGDTVNADFYKTHGNDGIDGDVKLKKGGSYTFRAIFIVPKDTPQKTLTIGVHNSRAWVYDVSGVK